jgi:tetratricopeptide (TPR) repeat protein
MYMAKSIGAERACDGVTATASARRAVELMAGLCKEYPDAPRYTMGLSMSDTLLAIGLMMTAQRVESKVVEREALRLADKLATEFPDVSAYKELQRWTYGCMSGRLEIWGELTDAVTAARAALKCQEPLLQKYPQVMRYQSAALFGHSNLGDLLWVLGRRKEATEEYRYVHELGKTVDRLHPDLQGACAWFLATCPAVEFRDIKRALEISQRLAARSPGNGDLQVNLAAAQYVNGDYQGVLRTLDGADKLGKNYPYTTPYHALFRAMAHQRLGNTDQALKNYDHAVEELTRNKLWYSEARILCAAAEQVLGLPPTKNVPPLATVVPP